MPSEIAGYADVVLPETTFLERHDELLVGFGRTGWTSLRQPVVAAPHEQKPGWWIAKQLAEQARASASACRSRTWRSTSRTASRSPATAGQTFKKRRRDHGRARSRSPSRTGSSSTFDTPSKKVEFWSDQLAKAGFDPVPKYTAPDAAPDGHFRLITGRAPVHTFSRTQTNPLLHDLMPENEVWVNAATAAKAGPEERRVREAEEPGRRASATASGSRPRSASARTASTWSTASATPARC